MEWSDVNFRLNSFLDDQPDAQGEYQFPLPLRIDGWNAAQAALGSHTLLEKTAVLTVANQLADLPDDCVQVAAVYEISAPYAAYTRRDYMPGVPVVDSDSGNNAYWAWQHQLAFDSRTVAPTVQLAYFASWPEVVYKITGNVAQLDAAHDTVSVPRWAITPLLYFTTAYCLQPHALRAAMIRNSNIRIDSGQPEDNSRRIQAREAFWWYEQLLKDFPPQIRQFGANS